MSRFTIYATIAVEVSAKDDVEAFEHFVDAINVAADERGIRDITVQHSETKETAFVVPPGAERWAIPCAAIWFSDDRKRAGMWDGSWWWTDGHIALRCEGELPEGFARVEEAAFAGAVGDAVPRTATTWSDDLESKDGDTFKSRRALTRPAIAAQVKFIDLVESCLPGVRWSVPDGELSAVHAYGPDDRLMALVMPVKSSTVHALPKRKKTGT